MTTEPIADFFDRECCALANETAGADPLSDPVARMLLDAVAADGFAGTTVLELGSGDGSFARALLRRGAGTVTGLDLSPRSVEHAADRASAEGLGERARYVVADAALAPLDAHDAVVSKRVFCCYPDAIRLLANTLPAARRMYVLALPESRGLVGVLARGFVRLANVWQWLRRERFRGYVHDVRLIESKITDAGFERLTADRHNGWLVLAFRRP